MIFFLSFIFLSKKKKYDHMEFNFSGLNHKHPEEDIAVTKKKKRKNIFPGDTSWITGKYCEMKMSICFFSSALISLSEKPHVTLLSTLHARLNFFLDPPRWWETRFTKGGNSMYDERVLSLVISFSSRALLACCSCDIPAWHNV
jgi:hypothetical protein